MPCCRATFYRPSRGFWTLARVAVWLYVGHNLAPLMIVWPPKMAAVTRNANDLTLRLMRGRRQVLIAPRDKMKKAKMMVCACEEERGRECDERDRQTVELG
ncbi:hypothetical protein PoB_004156600 [Plakobranchus ocellatus]|uniref:Secreted protein n=1 Tax=Plakobranchus ocellatus TaxID=259542 RepID=A0AAV4B8B0_9GAST|nr:hypothetical protein PoB_004156600 [Plakobranchus ocellatus]